MSDTYQAGHPIIQEAIKLQEIYNRGLAQSDARLRLADESQLSPQARKILSLFDQKNAPDIYRALADGGMTSTHTVGLPIGYQRTILREALAGLKVLDLVRVIIEPTTSYLVNVPYEIRKPGNIVNDGIVYESQPIPRASIVQSFDLVELVPTKLSLKITNEAIHFSSSLSDWDALARNIESNARLVKELIARRILNELQRSADAYGAIGVINESIDSQLTGNSSLIKTEHWPIVRQKFHIDLRGVQIAPVENPITLTINGAICSPFDGSGEQPAGIYYCVDNYNLGFIRLCDRTGQPVNPNATGICTLSYSHATNCGKFDLKLPAGSNAEDHLNGLLRAIGLRKAFMNSDRFSLPDYLLMGPLLNDTATNARSFAASSLKPGTALLPAGDLETIKALPVYNSSVPGSDLKDDRIILSSTDACLYVVAKVFETGTPFEAVDESGRPTGEKIAYGEEYSATHVPIAYRPRLSGIVVFDSDARAAAA